MNGNSIEAEEIFARAVELRGSEARLAYIRQACGDNASLHSTVLSLLDAIERDPNYFPDVPGEQTGDRIGRYRLIEKIGSGAFGDVWQAEQCEPFRRRVALKLIKPGMDTREVLARFSAERQALALLNHPNIARILDAGSTDKGRPFFVMEFVDGVSITEFCSSNNLDPTQRIEIFIEVCDAIHHAHQKGIIHRDIKPSNVLVAQRENKPVPIVIDFGIAKAIGQTLLNGTLSASPHLIGTPAYMSPEQASMSTHDIDTRSDVYSLGALLYELLTGSPPFNPAQLQNSGILGIRDAIQKLDLIRPSARLSQTTPNNRSLIRVLKREIDWIILKALEKDRDRRYESASDLAADLRCVLADEPVSAVAPALSYCLAKVWRKNRAVFLLAASFAIFLIAATIVSISFSLKAARAQELATERLRKSLLVQAQALGDTRQVGRRFHALAAIERSARIKPTLDARNAALKALTLTDLRLVWSGSIPQDQPAISSISPTLDVYASAENNGTLSVRKIHNNSKLFQLEPQRFPPANNVFSPNGCYLAVNYHRDWVPDKCEVWDWKKNKRLCSFSNVDPIGGIAFSFDNSKLATISTNHSVQIFDLDSLEITKVLPARRPWARVAFHPLDPHRIALFDSDHGLIEIINVPDGRTVSSIKTPGRAIRMAFNAAGDCLAAGGYDGEINIFEVRSGQLIRSLAGHTSAVPYVSFTQDDRFLLSLSWDGSVRVWNWKDGKEHLSLDANAFALGADGKTMLTLDGRAINLYEMENAPEINIVASHPGEGGICLSPQVHPDLPLLIVYVNGSLEFWD